MKLDININDFITEEHKKAIQNKISEAIKQINTADIIKEIEPRITEVLLDRVEDSILDNIFIDDTINEVLNKEIVKIVKERFKK